MNKKIKRLSKVRDFVCFFPFILLILTLFTGMNIALGGKLGVTIFSSFLLIGILIEVVHIWLLRKEQQVALRTKTSILAQFANFFLDVEFSKLTIDQSQLEARERKDLLEKHQKLESKILELHEKIAMEPMGFLSAILKDIVYMVAKFHDEVGYLKNEIHYFEREVNREVQYRNEQIEREERNKRELDEINRKHREKEIEREKRYKKQEEEINRRYRSYAKTYR